MSRKQKKILIRIIAAAFLTVLCIALTRIFELPQAAVMCAYAVPYLVIGYDILLKSAKGIARGQVFDENFLMAIATIGAFALGEYVEAAAVMLFYQTGELFQSIAVGKSRRSISALMDIRPDFANIERDGEIIKTDPYEVAVGSEIIVRAGEKIPIDGVIVSGTSALDASALTGESLPRSVHEDDEVQSGCINMTGLLKIRTTKEFDESTASKILELVENSGARKSRSEKFISKFAHYYTPAVCIGAFALAVIAPLIRMLAGADAEWGEWIGRALTFLVISCPCALVISIPLSFFAGIGGAGAKGILVKGSNYLEALSKIRAVVFDKTGTITKGVFEVVGIHHSPVEDRELLRYAALAESVSNHPIARSITAAYGGEIDKSAVEGAEEISGFGVTATVDGRNIAAGNDRLMEKLGIEYKACRSAGTVVHVAADGEYLGHILIADVIKPNAKKAAEELRKCGVRKIVMLTGDTMSAAKHISEEIGADELYASLLPADKVEKIETLIGEAPRKKGTVAFAGDGLNDAPVLSRADVGIAMGAFGSDAAVEAADIVIMDDDPLKIPLAVRTAKKCMRIVYQNISFAIGIKLACLALGALGIAGMWSAVFADVGVMVIAVLNALRTLRVE